MKARRTLHDRLSAQQALIGLLQAHPSPTFAEMAGMCGYDFLILDDEHGVFSARDYLQTLQALACIDVAVFVRLSGHDTQTVGRYLDMGAHGVIVPNVSTAEQASAFVRAMHYPPLGTRGFGASVHRGARYGLDIAAHLKAPRAPAALIVMIESKLGVANVDEILSIDGVDGAFIGPSDLTASLGCPGDFSNPVYAEAIARIEQVASAQGKILGTVPHPAYPMETLLARGHRLLIMGADISLIREAMITAVAKAKSWLD
jgi:2-keto-3-deoxy-L-rhamnonate aldolase RhmA